MKCKNKFCFSWWQWIIITSMAILVICSMTFVALRQQGVDLEKTRITQEEKTTRGHWLWGHWDDFMDK